MTMTHTSTGTKVRVRAEYADLHDHFMKSRHYNEALFYLHDLCLVSKYAESRPIAFDPNTGEPNKFKWVRASSLSETSFWWTPNCGRVLPKVLVDWLLDTLKSFKALRDRKPIVICSAPDLGIDIKPKLLVVEYDYIQLGSDTYEHGITIKPACLSKEALSNESLI